MISQRFAVATGLQPIDSELPSPQFMNGSEVYCYGAYKVNLTLKDSWERTRSFDAVYYAIDKQGPELVLGLPGLKKQKIIIDYGKKGWRYGFDKPSISVDSAKQFSRAVKKGAPVYAVMAMAPVAPPHERPIAGANMIMSPEDDPNAQSVLPDEYSEFADLFNDEKSSRLANRKDCDHAIDLEGKDPPYGPLYNLSNTELKILREYLDTALAKGWIRHSISPAGAPVLFAPKKNGKLRMCVDYRGLNKITRKNRHPLPLVTQILDQLTGCKHFTKLDLKDGYHQIRIRKGDEWKTAFRTRYGHFEYLVMPFGLANAPATFQAYVNKALAGLVDDFCVVYLDDILIFSKDRESHVEHVKQVLHRLRKYELYANLKKCEFFLERVEYLGFLISENGIEMDPRRVDTIKNWPKLKSFRDIQVFLGFANFYRRFIYRYSQITRPLTDMLKGMKAGVKKGPFNPNEDALAAFEKLKEAFQTAPILVHFNPELPIRLETDASEFGVAGIISQLQADGQWHPVAFYSRKMIPAERNYETHDAELLAIVMCFKQWRHYLEGSVHPIEVLTDHNNLRGFMNVKVLSGRQARWAMKIAAYDFIIKHRAGRTNPADAPSRRPDYQSVNTEVTRLLPTLQRKLSMIDTIQSVASQKVRAICAAVSDNLRSRIASSGGETLENSEGETSESTPTPERSQLEDSIEQAVPDAVAEEGETSEPIPPSEHRRVEDGMKQALPRAVAVEITKNENPLEDASKSVLDLIKALQQKDEFVINRLKRTSEAGGKRGRPPSANWAKDRGGLLRHRGRYYVPNEESLKAELLRLYHDDKLAGHYGSEKTIELLGRKFYWKGMAKYVEKYVKSCDICQRVKVPRHKPYGVMASLPLPSRPWKEITMDFVSGFPPSKRYSVVYDACLVIVDRFTKMALYLPVSKTIKAVDLSELIFDKVVLRFGSPNGIVSDRGSLFTSAYWSEICYYLQVKRRLSTAFHPQTDGQTERQNQILENYLRIFVTDNQSNWVALLPLAEFVHNSCTHSTTGVSPFKALYGYDPEIRFEVEDDIDRERVPAARERIKGLHELRSELAKQWLKASETQANSYNKKHKPKDFNTGDLVLLSAKNLKQKRPSKKLSHKFLGPFKVLEPVGKQAYRLALPPTYKIHPVFHVSYLEPYQRREGDDDIPSMPPPELINDEEEWEVEEVLGRKTRKGEIFYKVKWVGYPEDYNQWLPEENMGNSKALTRQYDEEKKRKRRKVA